MIDKTINRPMLNALSIDVEEWFCVSNYARVIRPAEWGAQESRIERQVDRLLVLLDGHGVKATFFMLGWVAERHPEMVRAVAKQGHEIASHGYGHQLVGDLTPEAFREDIRKAGDLLASLVGKPCIGYRAPSFSVRRDMSWAWDVLGGEGIQYDSSVFPVLHDRYGEPDAPRAPYDIRWSGGSIREIPPSTVRLRGRNLPVAGGGYLRLYPYTLTRWAIRRINQDGLPAVVYLHPWEIDPDQPSPSVPALVRWRHRVGMASLIRKLDRLLRDFDFGPVMALTKD